MRVNLKILGAYHESFKVGSPPLGETVSDFPLVVDAMRGVELARIDGRGEALIKATLEPLYFVLAWFEVVTWTEISSLCGKRIPNGYKAYSLKKAFAIWSMRI